MPSGTRWRPSSIRSGTASNRGVTMSHLREWLRRLAGTFGAGRRDADLREELRVHAEFAAAAEKKRERRGRRTRRAEWPSVTAASLRPWRRNVTSAALRGSARSAAICGMPSGACCAIAARSRWRCWPCRLASAPPPPFSASCTACSLTRFRFPTRRESCISSCSRTGKPSGPFRSTSSSSTARETASSPTWSAAEAATSSISGRG